MNLVTPDYRSAMAATVSTTRVHVVRRGQWLVWTTLSYNSLEGLLSVVAGVIAGSVALVGFGVDSFIEVTASVAAIWRLRADADARRRVFVERRALRVIGLCFLALATYVAVDATRSLTGRDAPAESLLGVAIAAASLVVMPLLARAKRDVANALASRAIRAEARQTDICMYLSAILLGGLGLNALFGWWWADPIAALGMVPLILWEGRAALLGRASCDDCCGDR
jgi:divalent metal cation (Fe/Co/Zn/Cd) transporter